MRDADEYLRRANVLLSISLATSNPVVAAKFREVAQDYLARAVKLRVDRGLSAMPQARAVPLRPRDAHQWSASSPP